MRSTLLSRAAVASGAVLTVAALTAAPSSAESADLSYACEYFVGDAEDAAEGSATWDSGIPDGLVVQVGDEVSLDPYTGTISLPDAFVDELRAQEVTTLDVWGFQVTVVDETGEPYFVDLAVPATPVPETGPMTVTATSTMSDVIVPEEPGTYTLVAVAFLLGDEEETTGLYCDLDDTGDVTVDTFVAEGDPTPTPTVTVTPTPTVTVTPVPAVTVTASPARPVLVQTDAAATPATTSAFVPGAALLGGALLAGGAVHGARRRTRRH